MEEKKEMVNHPDHYQFGDMETIDMMICIWGAEKTADWCMGNSFKYRMRAGKKGDAIEDINKALWYENKAKELRRR